MLKTPVMIIGAGPTGLMLSAQLHRFNVPHLIVDSKPDVTPLSKALGVQARTLEYYEQLGIAKAALDQGFVARSVNMMINGTLHQSIGLDEIGAGMSPYPYMFILEQSRNETLLHDYITTKGGGVKWQTTAVELKQTTDGYRGVLQHEDGKRQEFQCQYLAGCGGTDAPVRHFLDIPFVGETNEQEFFVADLDLKMDLEKDGLIFAISGREFLAFFPMSKADQYRVVGVLPSEISDTGGMSWDRLRDHIRESAGFPLEITSSAWYSTYRVHHRIADRFNVGNAFILGDEAHLHSPAGAQGMNTGLGDAVNLGWKLAGDVKGWSDGALVQSYHQERRPFGKLLVKTTDKVFALIVSKKWLPWMFRTYVQPRILKLVLRFNLFGHFMFKTISQTQISYRNSPLSDGSGLGKLQSGDRFPWFEWPEGNSFAWFARPGYVLLNFGTGCDIVAEQNAAPWSGPFVRIDIKGAAAKAAKEAGLPRNGAVLVRPDMHIEHVDIMAD